ncbi:hypothetical protein BDN71DRAFT_1205382 [Pleurotus eryngii]|uniref:Uncharacterized protein n=1 Tax=Pleurotus eryngii TaxID=5323 RepID=A0A9P6D5X6_PLEER|nr:hypothetical protein BDN71DRAFT_1205382 [Pleurotus eryngii]
MERVDDCIDHHIPFPDLLRYLTVKINTYPRSTGSEHSPELEPYVVMSAALQQIHGRLNLERVTVNTTYTADEAHSSRRGIGAREAGCGVFPAGGYRPVPCHSTFEWSDGHERTLLHHVFHNLGSTCPPSVEPRNLPDWRCFVILT